MQDTPPLQQLINALKTVKVPISKEKQTQHKIAVIICKLGLGFEREYWLDKEGNNIPDFFSETEGIAVEVKIKGQRTAIYKQLQRYCSFDQVKIMVLVTARSMGLPTEISGKPCYYINLSKAFL